MIVSTPKILGLLAVELVNHADEGHINALVILETSQGATAGCTQLNSRLSFFDKY
jgi:hypothetical protein